MNQTTAKVARTLSIAVLALSGFSPWCPAHAQAQPATALDLQSDHKLGYITLNSDLVLDDGRLVLAIGAFNKGTRAEELSPASVSITTAAGKPVPLVPFAQLEKETRARHGGKPGAMGEHGAATSAQPAIDTTAADESGGGYSSGDGLGAGAARKPRKKPDPQSAAKLQQALDNLHAAVLQGLTIEPRASGGGQVVTQALKFARGEPRKLSVAVDFAGERHQFEVEIPK